MISYVKSPTQYHKVPYSKIDFSDTRFQLLPFPREETDEELRRSIQTYGILQPPLLLEQSPRNFIVVSGKQRLQLSAEHSGNRDITALVVSNTYCDQPRKLFSLLVQHQTIGSSLSVIEQAVFFQKALDSLGEEELLQFLPILGYKKESHIPKKLIHLLELETVVQQELHNGLLTLRSGKKLLRFNAADQRVLVAVIKTFQLGGSKQQKLIDLIFELNKRLHISAENLLNRWQETEKDKQGNGPQKTASLLNWLQQQSSPRSVAAEKDFQKFYRQLQLPPGARLNHTPSFENDRLSLILDFNSKKALIRKWQQLKIILEQDS